MGYLKQGLRKLKSNNKPGRNPGLSNMIKTEKETKKKKRPAQSTQRLGPKQLSLAHWQSYTSICKRRELTHQTSWNNRNPERVELKQLYRAWVDVKRIASHLKKEEENALKIMHHGVHPYI